MLASQRRLLAQSAALGLAGRRPVPRWPRTTVSTWAWPPRTCRRTTISVPAAVADADDDRGFKGIVGFRPLDSFAIEANYVDLGETRVPLAVGVHHDALPDRGADRFAGRLRVGRRSHCVAARRSVRPRGLRALGIRAGAVRDGGTGGQDPTYGAGAQVRLGSFALRLEYERFDFDDDSAELVSVGFTYTFL